MEQQPLEEEPTQEPQPSQETPPKPERRAQRLEGDPTAHEPPDIKKIAVGGVILVGIALAVVGVVLLLIQPPAPAGIEPVGQVEPIETDTSEALTLANRVAEETPAQEEKTPPEASATTAEPAPTPQTEPEEPVAEPEPVEEPEPIKAETPKKSEKTSRVQKPSSTKKSANSKQRSESKKPDTTSERSRRRETKSQENERPQRPEATLVRSGTTLSAYEQLMRTRRTTRQTPKEEPVTLPPLSAKDKQAFEKALSNVNREFVRTIVEDGVNVSSIVGSRKWEKVRKSPQQYHAAVTRIYNRVLSTEDKARLYAAMEAKGSAPVSAPASLKELPLPSVTLTEAQKAVRQQRSEEIAKIVEESE